MSTLKRLLQVLFSLSLIAFVGGCRSEEIVADSCLPDENGFINCPTGPRPGEQFCLISPRSIQSVMMEKVLSDRLLFVWRGSMAQLRVSHNGQEVWRQLIAPSNQSIPYKGPALQPGQVYQWTTYSQTGTPIAQGSFQTVSVAERDRIQAEMTRLEAQTATNEMAVVDYLIKTDLRVDALQKAISIQKPSKKVTEQINQFISQACSSS